MKHIKPFVIGVIGGSGTGKTYFAKYVQSLTKGSFIEGDVIGHEVLLMSSIQQELVSSFGQGVVKDGLVDRQCLGAIVFNDHAKLLTLNKIMHPVMKDVIREQVAKTSQHVVILEAAVMIEAGFHELVDQMVYVKADEEVRLQRLIKGRKIDRDRAIAMIHSGRGDYRDYSHIILDTSYGIELLKKELDCLIDSLLEAMNESIN